jgi:PAS domain S-box-containing protein
MSLLSDAPEGLLQAMLETSPAGISIVSADGIRLYANPKFAELYRFADVDAAVGHPTSDAYVSAADHDHANRILERDGKLASFEVRQLRRDGEEWWCLLDKRPIGFAGQDSYISWHYDITDRKRAEQQVVEKANLLEMTLANIDQGIVVRDAEDQILMFNEKLPEMLGIAAEHYERGASTEELNALHARQGDVMMTPGSEERRAEWERRRRAGLSVGRLEYERRNARGDWHFCVRQPMPNGMEVRTFLDITEQKRAEQEAVEKARILRTTLDSMGQGLTMYDADWNLVSYNSRYREHFDLPDDVFHADCTFDDVVGATMRGDYGDDWRDRLTVVRDESRMTSEWRRSFVRPSGRSLDLLSIPVPSGGFIVTSTDISEIKRVEAALLRQQEINKTVLDAMDQGLLMIDGEGNCQLYNNRVCALINVPPEFLDAKPPHRDLINMQAERGDYRHVTREERNRLIALMRRLETDREPFVYERDIADGRVIEIRNNPLPEGGWVRVFTDITDRKRADREIAEKTHQLELTLETMEQGFLLLDEDNRTILHNAKAAELLGLPEEVLAKGATSHEIVDLQNAKGEFSRVEPALYERMKQIYDAERQGITASFSYERVRPDGSWVFVNNIPVEGGGYLQTYLDITARKSAEQAIAEKTQQLEVTLNSMEQGIILLDDQDRTVFYNDKAADMLGVPAEMLARGAASEETGAYQEAHGEFELLEPAALEYLESVMVEYHSGIVRPFSYERQKPDGRWVDVTAIPVEGGGSVRTFLDITARRNAEQAFAEKTRQLELTLETMDQGIILLNEDARTILYNAKAANLFGVPEEMLARGGNSREIFAYQTEQGEFDRIDPILRKSLDRVINSQTAGLQSPFSLERPRPDGSWILVNNIPVDGGGSLRTILDITQRKLAEEGLREARDAAEEATRAKSAFLAAMSHEIRTPMNGVVGMVEVLEQSALNDDQRQVTRTVRDSAISLLTIIDDILDFSKIEAGELDLEAVSVSVRQIAEGAIDIVGGNAIDKGVDIALLVAPDVPRMVKTDPVRLRQVMLNLLGNAVKFTDNGSVVVRVDVETPGETTVGLRFAISDTGIGIPAERLPALFQAFQQAEASTTRRFGGTGLGLSICERLVNIMGGEIGAESTVGQGSTFWFTVTFEVADEQVANPIDDIPLSGTSALIIEGSAPIAVMLRAVLEDRGVAVTIAETPERAVQEVAAAVAAGRRHDVLIVDGRFDAIELTEIARHFRVRQEHPNARAIWLHASDALPESVDPTQTFTQAVPRPIRRDALLRAVGVVLGRASPDLPVFEGPEVLSAHPVEPPSVEEALAQGRLILVAEDNETNRLVVQRQLALLGYAAEVAEDGAEALGMFDGKAYGLLLTDCHMPNMDGFDLTTAVRERELASGNHTPIVALTANALVGEAERCLNAGMDDYLAKPVRLKELGDTLARWIGEGAGRDRARDIPDAGSRTSGPSSMAVDGPIDTALFEEMIGGPDPEMSAMLCEAYLGSFAPLETEMAAALAARNPTALRKAAHAAAGAASSIAATRLTDALRRLEVCANEEDWGGAENAHGEARRRADEVTAFLQDVSNPTPP